jgi:hypothetical protein
MEVNRETDKVVLTREEYEDILRKAQKYEELGKRRNEWQKQNRAQVTEQRREYMKEYYKKKKAEKVLASSVVS